MRQASRHVVAGFIGTGKQKETGSGYEPTTYHFPNQTKHEASVFGVALLKYLAAQGRPAQRWLVMGTAQSIWDALVEIVPETQWASIESVWDEVGQAVREKAMTQAVLDRWSAALTAAAGLEVVCALVGPADDRDSQMRVWQAMYEQTGVGDHLTLDITHGFRHQPVLMTFMATTLRWFRRLARVDMYYGALELQQRVIELPLCNDFLDIAEALATYRYTDDFSQLVNVFGRVTQPEETLLRDLERVAFADSVNRFPRHAVEGAQRGLKNCAEGSALDRALAEALGESVGWITEPSFAARLRRKAEAAFESNQLLKGIVLLYEAICVAGCQRFQTGDPLNYRSRHGAKEALENDPVYKDAFVAVRNLRNSVAHGTAPESAELHAALDFTNPKAARAQIDGIVNCGFKLLDDLTAP
ncbi:MAG: TIGR02221 family CRISPR-associated protein [Chloracidobacterium sp.]|nr:TIGR02221 family CRISPR-associated protein [Chloracidobacterium sp.]MDW8216689.1 TIGR02221 family CRISPR-associated protein [Acidobacteriota bacterium]